MDDILYSLGWTLVAICSLPLNLLCFIVLKRAKNIADVTKVFLHSLTAVDLIFYLFRVVPTISFSATGRVLLGDVFCSMQSFMTYTSIYLMYPTLLAVNVERYICITYPLRYCIIVTKTKAVVGMICVWCISIGLIVWAGFEVN